jgi:hypothetical protein
VESREEWSETEEKYSGVKWSQYPGSSILVPEVYKRLCPGEEKFKSPPQTQAVVALYKQSALIFFSF